MSAASSRCSSQTSPRFPSPSKRLRRTPGLATPVGFCIESPLVMPAEPPSPLVAWSLAAPGHWLERPSPGCPGPSVWAELAPQDCAAAWVHWGGAPVLPLAGRSRSSTLEFKADADHAVERAGEAERLRVFSGTPSRPAKALPAAAALHSQNPTTPRARRREQTPPRAPLGAETALLRAIRDDDAEKARVALLADPEAISNTFFDVDFEPPLCAAVRWRASAEILELLLHHGADPNAADRHGDTPGLILSRMPGQRKNSFGMPVTNADLGALRLPAVEEQSVWSLKVARLLLNVGARLDEVDDLGCSLSQVAQQAGNEDLALFWQFAREARAAAVMTRALEREQCAGPLGALTHELLGDILSFVLPGACDAPRERPATRLDAPTAKILS